VLWFIYDWQDFNTFPFSLAFSILSHSDHVWWMWMSPLYLHTIILFFFLCSFISSCPLWSCLWGVNLLPVWNWVCESVVLQMTHLTQLIKRISLHTSPQCLVGRL
jgi:hypothetical protein